jgi:hypothetical protein
MAFMLTLNVGKIKFFLDGFKSDVNINKLFSGFNTKDFLPILKAQALSILYIFLWTLLFIITDFFKYISIDMFHIY